MSILINWQESLKSYIIWGRIFLSSRDLLPMKVLNRITPFLIFMAFSLSGFKISLDFQLHIDLTIITIKSRERLGVTQFYPPVSFIFIVIQLWGSFWSLLLNSQVCLFQTPRTWNIDTQHLRNFIDIVPCGDSLSWSASVVSALPGHK